MVLNLSNKAICPTGIDMRYEAYNPRILKELRAEKKLTQAELSTQIGLPIDSIKSYESGKIINPTINVLSIFGKFYNTYLFADWEK